MVNPMENVDDCGPGVQFLGGNLRRGRVEDFGADEATGVSEAHG